MDKLLLRRRHLMLSSLPSETVWGNAPLSFEARRAGPLSSLVRYGLCEQKPVNYLATVTQDGKCEQNGTPTPSSPVDIVCNNGMIKVSANLANVVSENIVVGKYINNSGVETADVANFFYAPYVSVTPGGTYTMATSDSIWYFSVAEYDATQTFLRRTVWGATNVPVGGEKTFTVGADCAFIRFGSNMKKAAISEADVLATTWMLTETAAALDYRPYKQLYIDGTPEVITDANGNTASAVNLLGAGDYVDTQEIISGAIRRKVGVYVFDGTENWEGSLGQKYYSLAKSAIMPAPISEAYLPLSTHFVGDSDYASNIGTCYFGANYLNVNYDNQGGSSSSANMAAYKAWLATQFRAGTPVIVMYPLATETTESVAGQTLAKAPLTVTAEVSNPNITTTEAPVSTPDPVHPLPIWCNNGVIKYGWHDIITTSQLTGYGTYVNPAQEPTTRAYRWFRSLENGTYQFSVDGNYEIIVQWRDPADPAGGVAQGYENLSEWMTSGVVTLDKTSGGYGIAVRRTAGSSTITLGNFDGVLNVAKQGIYVSGTPEVLTVSGVNLANMVAENIDVGKIIYENGSVSNSTVNFVYNKYIPVEAGQNYVLYGRRKSDNIISSYNRICWYDENKGWISRSTYTRDAIGSAVAPNNAKYARFTVAPYDNSDALTLDDVLDFNWTFAKATEEIPYEPYTAQTVNVEALLGAGNYKDTQEVVSGLIGRKMGVKVLTGQETGWTKSTTRPNTYIEPNLFSDKPINRVGVCSHFIVSDDGNALNSPGYLVFGSATVSANFSAPTDLDTVQKFKAWLASRYAAGDPVIVIYPLATPTTEQVQGQALYANKGANTVDSTTNTSPAEMSITYRE